MTTYVIHPFAPLYNRRSQILILGTIPSPASRECGFYYGHPRNRFWRILADIFDAPPPRNVAEKTRLVLANRLALWDTLAGCAINGAADNSIRAAAPNDFSPLLSRAKITRILCNGKTAWALYQKFCREKTGIDALALPSTSPANQTLHYAAILTAWRDAMT